MKTSFNIISVALWPLCFLRDSGPVRPQPAVRDHRENQMLQVVSAQRQGMQEMSGDGAP